MILAEVAEGEAIQVPAVGGVAERTEIGVMRSDNHHAAARTAETVKLLHGADDIGYVFNDVDRANLVERAVPKRVREPVQVTKDIGAGGGIPVDPEGTGILVDPAANVENAHFFILVATPPETRKFCENAGLIPTRFW